MNRQGTTRDVLLLAGLLGLLVVVGVYRPLIPIDETRYASVAWEMWARGDFLVPFRNGVAYHEKPPLLFWVIHAGWAVFGVNDWWPRLISPLFAAGTLALTWWLGIRLWPTRADVSQMAPFILLASLIYTYFASALMFDVMLSFFVALGFVGLVHAWKTGGGAGGFGLLALGLGGALYCKGPVALLHLLPLALLAPWWMREDRPGWARWYLGVALALVCGAIMILAWAIPAGMAGGEQYRQAIFWGQTAGRMTESFAHQAGWWYYLAYLPLALAPWLLWPRWWAGLRHGITDESGFRFALLGALFCLVFFSVISGKRWHYLLPELTLFALFCARALDATIAGRWSLLVPGLSLAALGLGALVAAPRIAASVAGVDDAAALYWGGAIAIATGAGLSSLRPGGALPDVRRVACATVLAAMALLAAFDVAMREPYDVQIVADKLAQFEREGRPVATEGKYHGQWHLSGRLLKPLVELPTEAVPGWMAQHPQGRVVFMYRKVEELPPGVQIEYERRYRGQNIAIVSAQ